MSSGLSAVFNAIWRASQGSILSNAASYRLASVLGKGCVDPIRSINSGQAFLWTKKDDYWYGVDGNTIIRVSQRDTLPEISYFNGDSEKDYFRLHQQNATILEDISRDPYVAGLVQAYPGLTVLRQDPFQCLISFICATNSSIPAIRLALVKITRTFGKAVQVDGLTHFTFPEPEKIAESSVQELKSCGVGYRASAIKESSVAVSSGQVDLKSLTTGDYMSAKKELLKLSGVGNKVADCILLFSLDKLEAFPIDVWIARALSLWYPGRVELPRSDKLTPKQYEQVSNRARDLFGKYAGYAQQFLYYHIRNENHRSW